MLPAKKLKQMKVLRKPCLLPKGTVNGSSSLSVPEATILANVVFRTSPLIDSSSLKGIKENND